MKKLIFTLFVLLTILSLKAQTELPCGFDSSYAFKIRRNANLPSEVRQFMLANQAFAKKLIPGKITLGTKRGMAQNFTHFVIPIVVHIIHAGDASNISNTQVQSGVDALNSAFQPYGIQFCLATVMPDGTPFNGITRRLDSLNRYRENLDEVALMNLDLLPRDKYVNIWVVKKILDDNGVDQGLVGNGSFPDSRKLGLVVRSDFFGKYNLTACPSCYFKNAGVKGKVLVHEMGHFLGLLHTFQDSCAGYADTNCALRGDYICDTPPMRYLNRSCIDTNTCTEFPIDRKDPLHNYMNYKEEVCMTEFTNEQVRMMYANIELYLETVIDPDNLRSVGARSCGYISALFKGDNTLLCGSGTVQLKAFDTLNSYHWEIILKGVTIAHRYTQNFSYNYTAIGEYTIRLTVTANGETITRELQNYIRVIDCGSTINSEKGNWYFGEYAGLTFKQYATIPEKSSYDGGQPGKKEQNLNSMEGCIVQNNKNGQLLFYGGGKHTNPNSSSHLDSFFLYDKTHKKMPHSPVMGTSTSAYGGRVVPGPGSGHRFYLFTTNSENLTNSYSWLHLGCHYSIIDTTLNGNYGDVDTNYRNVNLPVASGRENNPSTGAALTGEGICSIPGCDSSSYWLIVNSLPQYSQLGRYVQVYKITSGGITHWSQFDVGYQFMAYGSIVAFADGRYISNCGLVFEFNRKTGILKLKKDLQDRDGSNNPLKDFYHARFSPNSENLYILRHVEIGIDMYEKELRQYHMNTKLEEYARIPLKVNSYSLQNGPDGRMYISQFADKFMSYVARPDARNDYSQNNIDLQNDKVLLKSGLILMRSMGGLPNFIDAARQVDMAKRIYHRIDSCNKVYFYTNQCCATSYSWNLGDGSSPVTTDTVWHKYSGKTGTYYVTLVADGITLYDTIKFGFTGLVVQGNTSICDTTNNNHYNATAKPGRYKYNWIVTGGVIKAGQGKETVEVKWFTPGTVKLIATDEFSCRDTGSRSVQFSGIITNNKITIKDSCNIDSIIGTTPTGGGSNPFQYLWYWREFGDTTWLPLTAEKGKSMLPGTSQYAREFMRYVSSGFCYSMSNVVRVSTLGNFNKIRYVDVDYCFRRIRGTNIKQQFPGVTYQWQQSTDQSSWTNITGQTDSVLNLGLNTLDRIWYRRLVSAAGCNSSPSNILLGTPIDIVVQPKSYNICKYGDSFPIKFTYDIQTPNNGLYEISWMHKRVGPNKPWKNINITYGITSKIELKKYYNFSTGNKDTINISDTFRFSVIKAGCYDNNFVLSDMVTIKRVDSVIITSQPRDTTVNAGNSAMFRVIVNNPDICTYVWQYSANGTSGWKDIPDSNDDTFRIKYTGACQSNFYYRVKIIDPCKTKYSAKAKLTLTNLNSPTFDYWMKDQWTDTGAERNLDTVDLVRSPDIWVRHKRDSIRIHQDAYTNVDTNWVYVAVRNKGTTATNTAKLYLYWTWASTGEIWDTAWRYGSFNEYEVTRNGITHRYPMGGEINDLAIEIPPINPGDSVWISYPWTRMPQMFWYDLSKTFHKSKINVCYLARIQTCDIDPFGLTFKENRRILYNVGRNNNIVTKNSYVVSLQNPPVKGGGGNDGTKSPGLVIRNTVNGGVVTVVNTENQPDLIKFCISLKQPAYLVKADAYIEFGERLYTAWLASGSYSSGLTWMEGRIFKLTSSDACIYNIDIDSGFLDNVAMYFGYKDPSITFNQANVYDFSLRQYLQDGSVLGETWFNVRDNLFDPVPEILEYDSTINLCDWDPFANETLTYTISSPSLPHTVYDQTAEEYLELEESGNYTLPPGAYLVTCTNEAANQIVKTNVTIHLNSVNLVNNVDTVWYDCEFPDSVDYIKTCQNGVMYNSNDQVVPESYSGHYTLDPQEPWYTFVCADSTNCTKNTTQIHFKDIIQVPSSTSNYLSGMYNRYENPCCFIDLTEAECDGQTPLTFGQEIQVYNMNAELLYQTNLELYGGTNLGFRFCPPQWDTASNVISDWYSIVIRNDECSFCRMDFKCDSLGDSQPFIVLNYPSGQMKDKFNKYSEKSTFTESMKFSPNSFVEKLPTSISVFPNPTTSEVSVKVISTEYSNLTIQINDALGKKVYSNNFETTKGNMHIKLNLEPFSSGVYSVFIPELNFNSKLVIIK